MLGWLKRRQLRSGSKHAPSEPPPRLGQPRTLHHNPLSRNSESCLGSWPDELPSCSRDLGRLSKMTCHGLLCLPAPPLKAGAQVDMLPDVADPPLAIRFHIDSSKYRKAEL